MEPVKMKMVLLPRDLLMTDCLEYEFALDLDMEQIAEFMFVSYQLDLVIWDWFPIGGQVFDANVSFKLYKE